ncbi:Atrazine chlorohydrolase [Variovorax sp. PBS-H4]|uniref:amidohydrolase family protein n=1 Tax=Variovorax sp. PBS-H4 TaxID=434008 RepID=UPI001317C442|nr:amidohydrolase family protein [Variovorax sp. PBS-H4]VTU25945.1 Atrazine chlorohydrolase [Variovorax sp. PBS-H4]
MRPNSTSAGRTFITGATVVTMDEALGVLEDACVEIVADRIAAIGLPHEGTPAGAADTVIDGRGFIVFPGLVNAHMHTWQTALRSMASNWTLLEYFRWMHAGLGTLFAPEDIGIGTYAGALNQLNAGTTTLVDWCHNNPTAAHTDAAIDALARSGIRAAFFHGSPKPDPAPGQAPFWEVPHPRAEIQRLRADARFGSGGLLSLGMAILGPHYSTLEVALSDFALARELDLTVSMHQGGGPARAPEGWTVLARQGLLGPRVNIVHGNGLSDAQLDRFVESGMSFSITPENEMTQGHGHPIVGRLRDRGVAPSIGVDLESGLSGEMFIAARIAMVHQRALDNAAFRAAATGDAVIPETTTIHTLDALRWATIEGARMLGQQDRIGSITPGKQADLVLIDARLPNMQPVHDPVSTVLMQTSLANIDSVMVAGRWRKRHGALVDDHGRALDPQAWLPALQASGRRLAAAVGWKPAQPKDR